MKLRIKELCRAKGLTIADIADRLGTDASNLYSSLKGNPSLKRLQQVAEALNVGVGELFSEREPEIFTGTLTIDGQTYKVARANSDTVQLPRYANFAEFRSVIRTFVEHCLELDTPSSTMGILDITTAFCLAFSPADDKFILSLRFGAADIATRIYDVLEWQNGNAIALDDLCQEIINDVESPIR